jgi:hypothetical protein
MIPNRARGEAAVRIAGVDYLVCLNMGALAKIEAAVEARSLADLTVRLTQVSTDRLMKVVGVLLEAGGNPVPRAEMEQWPPSAVGEMTAAVEAAFRAAEPERKPDEDDRPQTTGRSPGPDGSAGSAGMSIAAA